jgi:enoyl-CoA hydratase
MHELRVETNDRIATVTLDRQPVNALTLTLYEQIAEVFESLGRTLDVNCVILTAAGQRAFCAGKDLHEFVAANVADDPAHALIVRRCFDAVLNCQVPTIAAITAAALGAGTVLASCCDIRIAADHATFSLPEINVGRCGGGAHVGRLISRGALRRMFFTGQPIDAREAFRLGLVDEVISAAALMDTARTLATSIAAKSPLGLRIGKRALNEAEQLSLSEGYAREQAASTELMATRDAREAVRAVLEKRAPIFEGR